ncbi:hypothetical protein BDV38DRAFT_195094 [Aspergillus pseudotamarii]|uniref:Uncharacterized protein n=1 Tax=Aspergillus pseudotamarii TaxID=132259 RepID=A0A5N6SI30_ASPPS|nr:uncharacterized protein BDV38DRAFT_195094 [Aspergillus pseudotamarii]KAE8133053.1 hypothetical protein BDV38DRAFT_195094 [Aspergillus pseudotamarii]
MGEKEGELAGTRKRRVWKEVRFPSGAKKKKEERGPELMIYRSLVNSSEASSEARFEAIKKEQPLALLTNQDQIDQKEQMHVKRRSKALEVCFQRSVRVNCCNRRTVGALTERQRCTGHKWKLNGPPRRKLVLRQLGVEFSFGLLGFLLCFSFGLFPSLRWPP